MLNISNFHSLCSECPPFAEMQKRRCCTIRQWLCRWHNAALLTTLQSISASTRLPWLVTSKHLGSDLDYLEATDLDRWIWCLSFKQQHYFKGMVRRCTVLLKDKQLACDWWAASPSVAAHHGSRHRSLWRLAQRISARHSQACLQRPKAWATLLKVERVWSSLSAVTSRFLTVISA